MAPRYTDTRTAGQAVSPRYATTSYTTIRLTLPCHPHPPHPRALLRHPRPPRAPHPLSQSSSNFAPSRTQLSTKLPPSYTVSRRAGMTTSRPSSLASHSLPDRDVVASSPSDLSNFEDISLDDAASSAAPPPSSTTTLSARRTQAREAHLRVTIPKSYSSPYPAEAHPQPPPSKNLSSRALTRTRDVQQQKFMPQRDPRPRDVPPSPRSPGRGPGGRSVSANGSLDPSRSNPRRPHVHLDPSTPSLPGARYRSPSPGFHLGPGDLRPGLLPRRSSWQSTRERKSISELERECEDDEEDDDDIPDGLFLDNVPISPRPTCDRPKSQPPSPRMAPRDNKPRRSIGSGTPPVATAQGSLRSPSWKSDTALSDAANATGANPDNIPHPLPSPLKGRAKSWNIAMATLSPEMQALTSKLEEHSDELTMQTHRPSHDNKRPATWDPSRQPFDPAWEPKLKKHSQLPELPPLRRTNAMIDPLPISKEKEAVLSRTRPSWLPPKDPAEEKRHLKQYQKMMAQSAEAERRKEAARTANSSHRDSAADSSMRVWEEGIIPRWGQAIREPRTRELWWKGVPPRSRGAVWSRAVGNELGLSEVSYTAALKRAKEAEERIKADTGDAEDARRAPWFEAIRKDAAERTWPDLRIFQVGGPLHDTLIDVLSAYAMYRGDIGYVPGCNSIAALLLLNLPNAADTFIALANALNRPIPLSFLASDPGAKTSAYNLVLQTLRDKSPTLHAHLTTKVPDADADVYLAAVFTSLFTGSLAVDEAARLWDVYVFEGDAILIRAAVALLLEEEVPLLGAATAEEVRAILAGGLGSKRQRRTLGDVGAEDRWMKAVREAGKA